MLLLASRRVTSQAVVLIEEGGKEQCLPLFRCLLLLGWLQYLLVKMLKLVLNITCILSISFSFSLFVSLFSPASELGTVLL